MRNQFCPAEFLIVASIALAFSPLISPAADWTRFRGPNGSGVAQITALPAAFSPTENLAWKSPIPPGHSSPVVNASRIFLTAAENEKLYTLCLSTKTGDMLWKQECPRPRAEPLDNRNHPAAASPAVDSDGVYVFFGDYGLLAYTHDGKERWRLPLGPFNNIYGMGASPIVVDNLVILVCDQRTGSFILAVDKTTGKIRWKTPRPDAVSGHSTPIIHQAAGGEKQILAPGSFRLDAYTLAGDSAWWANGLPSEMKSVPVLDAGNIYVAGFNVPANESGQQVSVPAFELALRQYNADGNQTLSKDELPEGRYRQFFGFSDLNRDGQLDEGEWRIYAATQASENGLRAIRLGGNGDTTIESLRWKYTRAVPQLPSPLIYRGILYMINDGGILTLLNLETGEERKRLRLREAVDHYYASPVAADNKIYFISQSGIVTVLDANQEGEILTVNELGEDAYATPALTNQGLIIRTAKTLWLFQTKPRQ